MSACCQLCYSQGSTSVGTEFWTGYMDHYNGTGSTMDLYITSDYNTSGTITIADGSFSAINFNVTAKKITIIQVPPAAFLGQDGVFNKGIHITAIKPIAVYAHIFALDASGATLLLPVTALGKNYYSINYQQFSNVSPTYSSFMVIATVDNTTVEVTPANALLDGHAAQVSFALTLNKGQIYQGLSSKDLTGTKIESVGAGTNSCQNIAVYSGSSRITIACNPSNNSSDNLFQQVYPTDSWGKNYITVPLENRNFDIIRIVLSTPTANVKLNGQPIASSSFNNGYYQFNSNVVNEINSDQPIQVVQYAVTQGETLNCGLDTSDVGDPEMIFLTPLEQTLDHVTLFSASNFLILQSYINVIIPTSARKSFYLDGVNYSNFMPFANDPSYSTAQIAVSPGTHTLSASTGFNAIAYGFGQHESYGYAAGANLQNLNSYVALQNPLTNSVQSNGCSGINYNIQLTLPYTTQTITWDFKDGNPPIVQNNPAIVNTTTKNGQALYTYGYSKNPVSFKAGNYSIIASVPNPVNGACGATEQIELDYNISDPPVAKFSATDLYLGDSTIFADQSTFTNVINTWSWNFGDGQTSGVQNPHHMYAATGTYPVSLTVTDLDGCTSTFESDETIILKPIGPGIITGNIVSCQGTASARPSIEQFTVYGTTLTDNITATAPPGFEISFDPVTGYGNKLILPESGGLVNSTLIYVRSSGTAPAGAISGNIVLSSAGKVSQNVNVFGAIYALPIADPPADQVFANGTLTTPIIFSGSANGFNWTNDDPAIGLASSGSGNIPSFNAVNTGTVPVVAHISVTPINTGCAYVSNTESNNVSVISTSTNKVINTINVGTAPYCSTLSPNGNLYVANSGSASVSVINTITNSVTHTIYVGKSPFSVTASKDGNKVFVVNTGDNSVSVINTASNAVTANIPVSVEPYELAVSNDGSTIYVVNEHQNSVSVYDVNTKALINNISVGSDPSYVLINNAGTYLYVTNSQSGTVSVISTTQNNVVATIKVQTGPAALSISPDDSKVYVSNTNSNSVSVINTTNNAVSNISVGEQPAGISVSPDGQEFYVVCLRDNDVWAIDAATNQEVAIVPVGTSPFSVGNFITSGSGCTGGPVKFNITINETLPVQLTISGNPVSLTTVYGTQLAATSFSVSGENLTQPVVITPPAGYEISTDNSNFNSSLTIGDAGSLSSTTIYIRLIKADTVNTYTGNIVVSTAGVKNQTLTMPESNVTPAVLTITADNKIKIQGSANPPLTFTYLGFVNSETPAVLTKLPQATTTAITMSPVGKYPITIAGAVAADYTFDYIPGILTIDPGLSIPNTFTPNGDNINDTWEIKYLENFQNCTVNVFNRYGQKVFSSLGYPKAWDGKYHGITLPSGAYYYIIDLKNGTGVVSGSVMIIR